MKRNEINKKVKEGLSSEEFMMFLQKFRGSLIFRGKGSLSYKYLTKIILAYKSVFAKNFEILIKKTVRNLLPVLGLSKIKKGYKVQLVPILLKPNKRYVLMNNWILRKQKNKFGAKLRGIDINEVISLMLKASKNEGWLSEYKQDYLVEVLRARFALIGRRKGRKTKEFYKYKKAVYQKRFDKYKKPYLLFMKNNLMLNNVRNIKNFLFSLYFLKYVWRSKDIDKKILSLKKFMVKNWMKNSFDKLFALNKWLKVNKNRFKKRKVPINIYKCKKIMLPYLKFFKLSKKWKNEVK